LPPLLFILAAMSTDQDQVETEEMEDNVSPESSEDGAQASTGIKGPKFWTILRNSTHTDRQVEPQHYLAAIAELLALTIATSFCITWTYSQIAYLCHEGKMYCPFPDFNFKYAKNRLKDNPIRNMVGYNNPCAFWDQPPALYIAAFMFCPMVYFAFRYAITDTVRAHLVMRQQSYDDDETLNLSSRACLTINWTYALSQCIVMGIFVITPHVYGDEWPSDWTTPQELEEDITKMHWKMRAHSACFLQLVPILCITMSANYFEAYMSDVPLKWTHWAALAFYVIATLAETFFATTAIFLYKGNYSQKGDWENNFVWNPLFMQFVDYTWFCSLPIAAAFQPPSPDLRIVSRLVDEENVPLKDDLDEDEAPEAVGVE
jgi:hypothetical protein